MTAQLSATCTNTADPTCGSQGIVQLSGFFDDGTQVLDVASAASTQGWTYFNGTVAAGNSEISGGYQSMPGAAYGNAAVGPSVIGNWDVRPATVPEPATLGLLGLGFAGIGAMRKRKAK